MTAVQEIAFVKMEPAFRNLFVADLELDVQKEDEVGPGRGHLRRNREPDKRICRSLSAMRQPHRTLHTQRLAVSLDFQGDVTEQ